MMKPSWANWAAIDADHKAYLFENEPDYDGKTWNSNGGKVQFVKVVRDNDVDPARSKVRL